MHLSSNRYFSYCFIWWTIAFQQLLPSNTPACGTSDTYVHTHAPCECLAAWGHETSSHVVQYFEAWSFSQWVALIKLHWSLAQSNEKATCMTGLISLLMNKISLCLSEVWMWLCANEIGVRGNFEAWPHIIPQSLCCSNEKSDNTLFELWAELERFTDWVEPEVTLQNPKTDPMYLTRGLPLEIISNNYY